MPFIREQSPKQTSTAIVNFIWSELARGRTLAILALAEKKLGHIEAYVSAKRKAGEALQTARTFLADNSVRISLISAKRIASRLESFDTILATLDEPPTHLFAQDR